jgi:hypothetical protein
LEDEYQARGLLAAEKDKAVTTRKPVGLSFFLLNFNVFRSHCPRDSCDG